MVIIIILINSTHMDTHTDTRESIRITMCVRFRSLFGRFMTPTYASNKANPLLRVPCSCRVLCSSAAAAAAAAGDEINLFKTLSSPRASPFDRLSVSSSGIALFRCSLLLLLCPRVAGAFSTYAAHLMLMRTVWLIRRENGKWRGRVVTGSLGIRSLSPLNGSRRSQSVSYVCVCSVGCW